MKFTDKNTNMLSVKEKKSELDMSEVIRFKPSVIIMQENEHVFILI